jgi:asparagine synthase (glutamine-hydrolysing)
MVGWLSGFVRSGVASLFYPQIVRAVKTDSLTYLDIAALKDLFDAVRELEARALEGVLIEAGCALGGSAIVMATAKSTTRALYVYDVFGMIPAPSEEDGPDVHARYKVIRDGRSEGLGGKQYYGYQPDLLGVVKQNFHRHRVAIDANNVHLVQGLFEETLDVRSPVALAHVDCDWYRPVMTCLQRIEPRIIPGGRLVIDDYGAWSGCRKAVDEYFLDKRNRYDFVKRSRLHVIHR